MDVTVDGDGAFLAGCDSIDAELRTGNYIAACEYVGNAGLVGLGINKDVALGAALELHAAKVYRLADGGDNGVDLDYIKLTGSDRCSAALRVCFAELHLLDHELLNLALADDLSGSCEVHELDALFNCFFDLIVSSGHLVSAAAVDDGDILCAEADSGACNVDSDIAAADNSDLLAYIGSLAEVDVLEEVNAGERAGQIVTLAADSIAFGGADAEVECFEAVGTELIEGDVLADLNAGLELNAHLAEDLDLSVYDLSVKAE